MAAGPALVALGALTMRVGDREVISAVMAVKLAVLATSPAAFMSI